METFAVLFGETEPTITPAEFANVCLVGALPRLAEAVTKHAPDSPYAALARIAAGAIRAFRVEPDREAQHRRKRAAGRADLSLGVWRHCEICGKPLAREKEIQIMIKALAQANHPAIFWPPVQTAATRRRVSSSARSVDAFHPVGQSG
jgi:hypothetical protein